MAGLGAAHFLEQEVGRRTVVFLPHHCGEQEAVLIVRCQSDRGEFVKQVKPDVRIIMTYGGSGITKAPLGSVTEEFLQSLDVDILAFPPIR